jgi:hypothetical protein
VSDGLFRRIISPSVYHGKIMSLSKKKMKEFIAIQIMVAQAQRLYPKLDPFDPNCQHIALLNSYVKSFSKQFKNTDMRTF